MSSPLPPDLLEVAAERFRLLGDPSRLRLLSALMEREEATVQDLADAAGLSHQNASKHLRKLAEAGLVGDRRDGLYVRYRVIDPSVSGLCLVMCGALRGGAP
jgi:ArsR family transcriptional regulator